MSAGRQPSYKSNWSWIILPLLFLVSCGVVPRNYPRNTPFVFKYNVDVEGKYTVEEKEELESRLENQLDDSIRVRTLRKLFYRGINRAVLDNPPVYDSNNAQKSILFMRALLGSLGYFRDTITYRATIDTVQDQYRTSVDFTVKPGKVVTIDSFSYNIEHPELQRLALENQSAALVKEGSPFARNAISVELDRLSDLYRNNGYLLFGRELLIGLWDTVDVSLLRPTVDPLEQLEILRQLQARRDTPTADLEIRLRPGYDSAKLRKFYIGSIDVYPDFGDTTGFTRRESVEDGIRVISFRNMFRHQIIPENIFMRRGEVYDQRKYYQTLNRFNSLGAWRLANMEAFPREDSDTADFVLQLSPSRKYSFTANLEASRNQSAVSGNLFGIGINLGLQNRNFARSANQANTNLRYGIETGRDKVTDLKFIQTRQLSLSHVIYFPRPIPRSFIPTRYRDNVRTVLSFNGSITERRELYDLNTLNAAWGYEFTGNKKVLTLRIPNIEYSSFTSKPKLQDIIRNNPSLINIFTDGFISSFMASYSVTGGRKNDVNVFKANLEHSGILLGMVRNRFLDTNLYRFIKLDADFARKITWGKTALALRIFAGVGYELDSTRNPEKRSSLPFFKQYFAGGPNSMRAWGLRKLGQGSAIKNDTNGNPDRFGDVQLEANVEFRFPVFDFSGVLVNMALFTDVGNVWFLKREAGFPEEVFKFDRLFKDLGVGVGIGARIDFSFFVVRLDYAYKAKDPSPSLQFASYQNRWFAYKLHQGDQFQLGINYPFVQ
jgi:outer membrane protein assembly factor BamA